ncbi:DgyrCDS6415 [Dimorphilus gyrociliatus]|uniref:DgyrCDS6415 n=1 Tax=Dimorphilus gyrociliatus TaxID=2664684 RepID=A0A7I8VSR9_9ANNE|nr:DgyrCDS6415 [Dimorphilus gyrociliatus]
MSTPPRMSSRCGSKLSTRAKHNTTNVVNWFNLVMQEMPDLKEETERSFLGVDCLFSKSFCVEMLLTTVEQEDYLSLETFSVSMSNTQSDINNISTFNLFEHLTTLLKNLISLTRTLPSYKLSRQQGPDSFVCCYKLYMDEPDFSGLGSSFRTEQIGSVSTPLGTVHLKVAYREKMQFSPSSSRRLVDDLKVDHFNVEASCLKRQNEPIKIVQSPHAKRSYQKEETVIKSPTSDDGSLKPNGLFQENGQSIDDDEEEDWHSILQKRNVDKQPATFCENINNQQNIPSVEDLPYVNLLKLGLEANIKSASELKKSNQPAVAEKQKLTPPSSSDSSASSDQSEFDTKSKLHSKRNGGSEFVVVEKCPFASNDENDLMAFYRQFMNPAQLQCMKEPIDNGLTIDDEEPFAFEEDETVMKRSVGRTLEDFEQEVPIFDEMVAMLEEKMKKYNMT